MATRSFLPRGLAFCALLAQSACLHGSASTPLAEMSTRSAGELASGRPGLEVQVEERFYEVSAVNAATLNRALLREGPQAQGRKAHALTEWRLSWSYVPRREGAGCASSDPKVSVRIVTTLPAWVELPDATERLSWDWSLFMDRLRHHESEHQDIAVRNGRALLALLRDLEAEDCESLQEVARRVAAELESSHEELHARFDGSADYGVESFR